MQGSCLQVQQPALHCSSGLQGGRSACCGSPSQSAGPRLCPLQVAQPSRFLPSGAADILYISASRGSRARQSVLQLTSHHSAALARAQPQRAVCCLQVPQPPPHHSAAFTCRCPHAGHVPEAGRGICGHHRLCLQPGGLLTSAVSAQFARPRECPQAPAGESRALQPMLQPELPHTVLSPSGPALSEHEAA